MTDRLQRLCDEIRELEPAARAEVQRLLDSHDVVTEPAIERVWLDEARRRFAVMAAEAAAAEVEVVESPEDARERLAQHLARSKTPVAARKAGR